MLGINDDLTCQGDLILKPHLCHRMQDSVVLGVLQVLWDKV